MKLSDIHAETHFSSPADSALALMHWQDQGFTQERETMQDLQRDQMSTSSMLKKEDFPQPRQVTIKDMGTHDFGRDGEKSEVKRILYFHETPKGLTLNNTNIDLIFLVTQTSSTGQWVGKKIVLFHDPDVEYPKGTKIGGIRVAVPKELQRGRQAQDAAAALYGNQQPTPPVEAYNNDPQAGADNGFDDEIPWP